MSFYFYPKDFIYNKITQKTQSREERRDADGYQPDFLPFGGRGADAVPDLDIYHA